MKKLFLSILLILVICAPSLADEFKIELVQGWNLKSSRIAITIADTFSSSDSFASVWKWENGGWAVYLPGEETQGGYAESKGFTTFSTISPGEGFWVNSKGTQTSVTITGTQVDIDTISMVDGWNLKGLKAESSIIVSSLFANSTKFASVWKWESGGWAVYLPDEETQGTYATAKGFSLLSSISPGEGFWVNATAAGAGEIEPMPPLVESQVLDSTFAGKYVPVQGAEVYFNEVKIADTDINGSFGFGIFYGEVFNASGAGLDGVQISTDYGVKAVSLPNGAYLLPHPPGTFTLKAELTGYKTFEIAATIGSLGYKEVSISMEPQVSKKMTRLSSLYKGMYNIIQDVPISIKANGYLIETATLNLSTGLMDPLFIREEEYVPEEKFEENNLAVVKGSFDVSTFKTCPNLFVLETPSEAIPAAPTPKVFSDDKSAIIITKMKLKKDITVAVQTFGSKDIIENITSIEEAAQSSYIIGGADVLISTGEGSITSEAAGFSARVRAVTKENLSESALSFAQMKTAIDSGTGEVYLFYYHEDKWQMAGAGAIEEKSNGDNSFYQAVSGEGVFYEGLYPFLFVYAGKKVITGKVVKGPEGTEPVPNALITITSSRDTTVSDSDGIFSITIPDALTSVRMKILHKDYYIMEKPVEFTGNETKKDIGNLFLMPLSKKNLQGTVKTHKLELVANATVVVTIQNKPINIIFPDVIQTKTRSNGLYSIAGIPVDVLGSAVVNVITEDGYDPGFKTSIPVSQTDTVTLDFVLVAPLWTYQTNGNIYSSPTINDGNVYIGSCDGKLYCRNAETGVKVWDYTTNPGAGPLAIFATPAIDTDNVFFGTLNNQFYSLNKDSGEKSWIVDQVNGFPDFTDNTNIISSPTLDSDVLFFGSSDNAIYSYKVDSSPQWSNVKGGNITATPAYYNGRIYFGSWDGYFYCHGTSLNINDENYYTEKWKYPTDTPLPGRILSSPTIAGDKVFFGGGNNLEEDSGGASVTAGDTNIYCLNLSDGTEVWKYATGGAIVSKSAVVGDKLYVGSLDGKVYCLDANAGTEIWTFATDDEVYSSPFVSNGKVYIGSNDNYLYCLDAGTGEEIWSFKTRGEVISSPKIDSGKIYFGSLDGEIYCVEE